MFFGSNHSISTNMSIHTIVSINPATKKTIGSVQASPTNQLPPIFERAQKATVSWSSLRLTQRSQMLRLVRKKLVAHMDELSELIASETGKTNWEGFLEVFTAVEHLRHISRHGPEYLRTEHRSSGVFLHKKCLSY